MDPCVSSDLTLDQYGWRNRRGSSVSIGRNSEP